MSNDDKRERKKETTNKYNEWGFDLTEHVFFRTFKSETHTHHTARASCYDRRTPTQTVCVRILSVKLTYATSKR